MPDHRQEAEERLAGIDRAYRATQTLMPPELLASMAIAHALLALGDQIAHDWEEDPDA
jgi:hypothetical protein